VLLVVGGLLGTGENHHARALCARIAEVHLQIDTIEQVLPTTPSRGQEVGDSGYLVAYHLAEDNLRIGRSARCS
jgi:predicted kinase